MIHARAPATPRGLHPQEPVVFTSPLGGQDWVLVLDDATHGCCATRHPLPTACTGHYGCSEQVPAPTRTERSEWVSDTFDVGRIMTITTIVSDS
jgi:hypothetical protein